MIVDRMQAGLIKWWLIPLLPLIAFILWAAALPSVRVHYPKEAQEEMSYIWNVQHRIYKGRMAPGGGAFDKGHLFPDENFFMAFDWWSREGNGRHCVSIKPKWPNTDIYLNADGSINLSEEGGTDVDRLRKCR